MAILGFGKKKFKDFKAKEESLYGNVNNQFITKYRNFGVNIKKTYLEKDFDVEFLFAGGVSKDAKNHIIALENFFSHLVTFFKKNGKMANYNIIIILDDYNKRQQINNIKTDKTHTVALEELEYFTNSYIKKLKEQENESKNIKYEDVLVYIVEFIDNNDGGRPVYISDYRNKKLESDLKKVA